MIFMAIVSLKHYLKICQEYITILVTFDKKDYSVTGIRVYQGFHAGEVFDDNESFATVCRSLLVNNLSKEKIIDAAKRVLNK